MKKKLILVFLGIFLCLGFAAGAFFLSEYIDESQPWKRQNDADRLVSSVWRMLDDSGEPTTVLWSFNKDATCVITTNQIEYFDCTWFLEDGVLGITTSWLDELHDEFDFKMTVDREKSSFSVTNKKDGKESHFVQPAPLE